MKRRQLVSLGVIGCRAVKLLQRRMKTSSREVCGGVSGIQNDGAIKIGKGALILAEAHIGNGSVPVRPWMIRFQPNCLRIVLTRALLFSKVIIDIAAIHVRHAIAWIKPDRLIQVGDCAAMLPEQIVRKPTVHEVIRNCRVEFDRLGELLECPLILTTFALLDSSFIECGTRGPAAATH
jgi:hypothetical protein